MTRLTCLVAGVCAALVTGSLVVAQQPAADVLLVNGKIITVDERFSIAQAVAVRGDRIVAVGTDQEVRRLAGPGTRTIDLAGRAVVPGLIDNHMHLMRYGTTWRWEVRLDGIGSRKEALSRLAAKAKAAGPGQWVYTLGGWAIEQFADDSRPFTRQELDEVVPDNPVFLQASYYEAYLNSRALDELGLAGAASADGSIERDAAGQPTGRIDEAGFRRLVGRLPTAGDEEIEASTRGMIADLNRSGLTSFGSAGCESELMPLYRKWADEGELNVRVFCITGVGAGSPEQVDRALPRIAQLKFFQGDDYLDTILFGEGVYGPLHDPMFVPRSDPRPEQLVQWRRLATEIAKAGLPLHVHANLTDTISAFLDQIEAVNKEYPVKNLRWTLAHANQLNASHLERMKRLGIYAAVHPWAVINGGINHRIFGESAYDMAALDTIQRSGVMWGFGSDGSRANQILPFTTLWWAVTGKMVGGREVLRQTISREDALIAHTRKNAYFLFQESNLGSIQPGKYADLVVLDRDYLTVPADQIKDITPLMTMVGGRIVYESGATSPRTGR